MDILRQELYTEPINSVQYYLNNLLDNFEADPPPFSYETVFIDVSYLSRLIDKLHNVVTKVLENSILIKLKPIVLLIQCLLTNKIPNNIKSKLDSINIKLRMDIKQIEQSQQNNLQDKYINMSPNQVIEDSSKTGKFPILYNIDKRSRKRKFWSIDVNTFDDNTAQFIVKYGVVGSDKIQTKTTHITDGKNKGKKSETSPFEQAVKQALSKFKTKLKVMSYDKENLAMISKRIYPMLANDYSKIKSGSKTKMKFPAAVQRKYDGDRCTANCVILEGEYKIELRGRDRNIIHNCKHIEIELLDVFNNINYDIDTYLDGELYKMGMALQTINGLVRRVNGLETSNNIDNAKELEFHVFDCFMLNNLNIQFKDRSKWLKDLIDNKYKKILYVENVIADNEAEMIELTKKYISEGYEGAILRDLYSPYVCASSKSTGRSNYLQKYKISKYDTAIIKDLEEKPNVSGFGFVFHCIHTSTGIPFKINANGNVDYKKKVYMIKDQYINKMLRYMYTEETKTKIPRYSYPVLDKDGTYIITIPEQSSFEEKIHQLLQ